MSEQPHHPPTATLPFPRKPSACVTCGTAIPPTGRRGRPPKRCATCRDAGVPAPPPTTSSAADSRYDLRQLATRKAVNVAEAAALIGWSPASLYAAWARGDGPPRFKDGAKVTIPTAGLDRWLAERAAAEAAR